MKVLGVDPGGRWTGLVVVERGRAVARATVERGSRVGDGSTDHDYLDDVVVELDAAHTRYGVELVAVEDVRRPVPQAGHRPTNPAGIIAAAVVLGRVIGWADERGRPVAIVPPGGHGSSPRAAYPPELRRHERSAYDVALAAPSTIHTAT